MPTARNEAELSRIIKEKVQKAVNYVMQKIWLENRSAMSLIYDNPSAPLSYVRTYQFRDAWVISPSDYNPTSADAYGVFYYKPDVMKSSDYGQHKAIAKGKRNELGESSVEYLADILYQGKGGTAWHGNNPTRRKRNVYKELLRRVGKRKLSNWMLEGLEQQGFKVQRHRTAIHFEEYED